MPDFVELLEESAMMRELTMTTLRQQCEIEVWLI